MPAGVPAPAALAEEVKSGHVVYHGNAGHLMLKGAHAVLRVRVVAPIEKRLAMLEERLNLSGNEALEYIQRADEERRKWTRYLYGVNWEDPVLYDVVFNLENIEIDQACRSINTLIRTCKCFQFTPECQTELQDLATASRVRANVALNPPTSHLEIEVEAMGGHVAIRGKVTEADERKEVERVALAVPGVTTVNLSELIPSTRV